MKTPTLAQLRKLAKKKGDGQLHRSRLGDFDMSFYGDGIFVNVTSLTARQTRASLFAALSALPDAEKAKGGA